MANSKLKGITIEIGGDTTKLTQALKGPQEQTQKLKDQLKDLNYSLKLDTSNVDLLNQKQRVLKEAISSTKDELKILKDSQKEYIESGKDLDTTDYIALEREIAAVEARLKSLESQQTNFNGQVQAMGIHLEEFGKKATTLGTNLTKSVTTPIIGIGTAAVASFNDLKSGYNIVATGTGAVKEDLDKLKTSFNNVFGNFPGDVESVGTALADINTRFGLENELLEESTDKFLKFSRVNNSDLSGSIENVHKWMSTTNTDTSELNSVLDKLTVASQASGLSVDDMTASLSKNSLTLRELGLSTDQQIALLTTFEKTGEDSSVMLKGMQKAFQNWSKAGVDAGTAFQDTIAGIEKGTISAEEAMDVFGSKAGASIYEFAKQGKLDISSMMEVIAKSAGGLENTYNETLTASDKLKISFNNLKIVGSKFGEVIMEQVTPILDKAIDGIKRATAWFTNLDDSTKQNIVRFAALAAAIGPLILAVGKLSTGAGQLIKYFNSTVTAGGKLISGIKGIAGVSQIGIGAFTGITAAIGVLVGAFFTLWNTNEDFRNSITSIWNGIVERCKQFVKNIADKLAELNIDFDGIIKWIQDAWMSFCNFLAPVFETAFQAIADTLDLILTKTEDFVGWIVKLINGDFIGAWHDAEGAVADFGDFIKNSIDDAIDSVIGTVQEFLSWFGIEWEPDLEGIHEAWDNIWNSITEIIHQAYDIIISVIGGLIEWIQEHWQDICDFFVPIFQTAWDTICQVMQNAFDAISGIFEIFSALFSGDWEGFWTGIQHFLDGIWSGIGNIISGALDIVTHIIEEFLSWFGIEWDLSWVSEAWDACWSWLGTLLDDAIQVIKGIAGAFISLFTGDWEGFCDGISEAWHGLWSFVGDFIGGIIDGIVSCIETFLSWFGINWDLSWVSDAWNAFWNGLGAVVDTVVGWIKDAIGWLIDGIGGIADTVGNVVNGVGNFFGDIWNTVTGTTKESTEKVVSTVKESGKQLNKENEKTYKELTKTTKKQLGETEKVATSSFKTTAEKASYYSKSAYQSYSFNYKELSSSVALSTGKISSNIVEMADSSETAMKAMTMAADIQMKGLSEAMDLGTKAVNSFASEGLTTAQEDAARIFTQMYEDAVNYSKETGASVYETFSQMRDDIASGLEGTNDEVYMAFCEIANSVDEPLANLDNSVQSALTNINNSFADQLGDAKITTSNELGQIRDDSGIKAEEVVSYVSAGISGITSAITDPFAEGKEGALEEVDDLKEQVSPKAKEIVAEFELGLNPMVEAIVGKSEQAKDESLQNFDDLDTGVQDKITSMVDAVPLSLEVMNRSWKGKLGTLKSNTKTEFTTVKTDSDKTVKDTVRLVDNSLETMKKGWAGKIKNVKSDNKSTFDTIRTDTKDSVEKLSSSVTEKFGNMESKLKTKALNIKQNMDPISKGVDESVRKFRELDSKVSEHMNNARNKTQETANSMKGMFSGWSFQMPKIPLPHFSLVPKGWSMGDLLKGTIPGISISWYAKAMDKGMILDKPTIFGSDGTSLLAGGEAGKEAVVGLSSLEGMIDSTIDKALRNTFEAYRYKNLDRTQNMMEIDYDRLAQAMIDGLSNVQINNSFSIGSKQVVNELIPAIDKGLERRKNRR